jgi:nucleotide-binding universal stress UspA family protein
MRVQLKKIVCCVDFSDYSEQVLSYGVALAKEFDSALTVCHVVDLPAAGMHGEAILYTQDQQTQLVEYAKTEVKRLVGERFDRWQVHVTPGHTADEITRLAREQNSDLVISATHGRAGLRRLILGSVTERLMKSLPCPLLVVRKPEKDFVASADQGIRLKRILVGCDFSPYSNLALRYGLGLAQEFEAELHLVHVIEPPVYKGLMKQAAERSADFEESLRDRLDRELLDMVPEEAKVWCAPKPVLLAGQPHEELTKYAVVQDMDMIVLGVHGRGLVEDLLLGSTTDRVVREAPCPVLSVRPVDED